MIGATVDQFKITQALENKAIYEVFSAQHIQTGSQFELHAINPNLTMDRGFSEKLKAEVSQLIGLEHPAIISPLNILELEQRLYIVYPMEESQSLLQLLKNNSGNFPIEGLMRIFKDILRGIGFAHSQGFFHRALNLEAIRVNDSGDAKLRGFGNLLFNALANHLGKDGMLCFAKYYAPERFSNPKTEDIRANIYSLGAMLYEMTTGHIPVQGDSLFMLEMAHADPDNKPLSADSLRPDLPSGFAGMLQKALAKKPESRFQNPIEFFKEIEKIESKRKSELFNEDFTKGFGNVEDDSFSLSGDDLSDHSSSFKIEDPFGESGFDLGLDLTTDAQKSTDQFDLDKTVKDSSFDPKMLSGLQTGKLPEPKVAPAEEPIAGSASESNSFDPNPESDPFSTFGSAEDPFKGLSSESEPASNPFAASSSPASSTDFSFDTGSQAPLAMAAQDTPPAPSPFDFDLGTQDSSVDDSVKGIEMSFNSGPDQPMEIERNDTFGAGQSEAFSSEDGAFHFTAAPADMPADGFEGPIGLDIPQDYNMPMPSEEEPMAIPSVRRMEQKLGDSLKAAQRKTLQVKSLKKRNPMVPVLGVAGFLAVCIIGWFFYRGYQQNQEYKKHTEQIKHFIAVRQYQQAMDLVEDTLDGNLNRDQQKQVELFRSSIEKTMLDVQKDIENYMDKARVYEVQGKRLINGEKDAFSLYKTILKIDPENVQAAQEMKRICDLELNQIDQMIESGDGLSAIQKLRVLKKNYDDPTIVERYNILENTLKQEKGLELEKTLVKKYEAGKYTELLPIMDDLRKIDPDSKFIAEKEKQISKTLVQMGMKFQERKDFEKAESYYLLAQSISPGNKKIVDRLDSVKENAEMLRIERAEDDLDTALNKGDLKMQLLTANKLAGFDPGNVKASNALIEIKEKIRIKRAEADRMRALGRFREASEQYKEVYRITGRDDVKKLWNQYRNWSPPKGMVYIPGGRFRIGYSPNPDSRPSHYVSLSPYYVDKFEVTNSQYLVFVNANPKWAPGKNAPALHGPNYLRHWVNGVPSPGTENEPVVFVSYYAAQAYAASVGKRLLTEAEWEVAAAGGTTGQKYWWGKSSSATQAVYNKYSRRRPSPIGAFPANEYGIYEILGNVSEWVADRFDPDFYSSSKNAKNPKCTQGDLCIHRGGSFRHLGREITIYHRFVADPLLCEAYIGIRCGK